MVPDGKRNAEPQAVRIVTGPAERYFQSDRALFKSGIPSSMKKIFFTSAS